MCTGIYLINCEREIVIIHPFYEWIYIYTWKQGGGGSKKLARKRSIQGVELGVRNEWSKWEFLDWPWQVVCTLSSRRERVTKGSGQARVGSSTTCLPLIPLVGQRWRGLVVGYRYERILERIPSSILTKRREVVNNESQVTTGGVLPRGDRKRARNFPLKVTKNELKFRKNFETSSLTVHLEKLWKNWKKRKEKEERKSFSSFFDRSKHQSRFEISKEWPNVSMKISEGKGGFCVLRGGLSRLSP